MSLPSLVTLEADGEVFYLDQEVLAAQGLPIDVFRQALQVEEAKETIKQHLRTFSALTQQRILEYQQQQQLLAFEYQQQQQQQQYMMMMLQQQQQQQDQGGYDDMQDEGDELDDDLDDDENLTPEQLARRQKRRDRKLRRNAVRDTTEVADSAVLRQQAIEEAEAVDELLFDTAAMTESQRSTNADMRQQIKDAKGLRTSFVQRYYPFFEPFLEPSQREQYAPAQYEHNPSSPIQLPDWRKDLRGSVYDKQPVHIVGGEMREYQLSGLNWLLSRHDWGMPAILGDEMGLGKTLTCISFISALLFDRKVSGPFLVVVPLSVLSTWMAEFKVCHF